MGGDEDDIARGGGVTISSGLAEAVAELYASAAKIAADAARAREEASQVAQQAAQLRAQAHAMTRSGCPQPRQVAYLASDFPSEPKTS